MNLIIPNLQIVGISSSSQFNSSYAPNLAFNYTRNDGWVTGNTTYYNSNGNHRGSTIDGECIRIDFKAETTINAFSFRNRFAFPNEAQPNRIKLFYGTSQTNFQRIETQHNNLSFSYTPRDQRSNSLGDQNEYFFYVDKLKANQFTLQIIGFSVNCYARYNYVGICQLKFWS
jgi:hypothetical protein